MNSVRFRRAAAATAAAAVLFGMSACSNDEGADDAAADTQSEDSAQQDDGAGAADDAEAGDEPEDSEDAASQDDEENGEDSQAADEEEADSDDDASSGSLTAASWADDPQTEGEEIANFDAGDVNIRVLQVGTAESPKDGMWADPDTNEPLIAEGDELVFVRYVVTNEGDPVDLGASLVQIEAEYEDWAYMQGMGGVIDSQMEEEMGVRTDGATEYHEDNIYTFDTGESYSYAENFLYEPGTTLNVEAKVIPVDEDADLLHDQKVEGEGSGTIE